MKKLGAVTVILAVAGVLAVAAIVSASSEQASKPGDAAEIEKAVLARLTQIKNAAEGLDPDKVFSYVLENDKGALVQNGRLFLTRTEALQMTQQAFQRLQKVEYKFDQQHVTLLSPSIALVVGQGFSTATTQEGTVITTAFAQSVVLVLTNGEWKVLHAHRSFPPR